MTKTSDKLRLFEAYQDERDFADRLAAALQDVYASVSPECLYRDWDSVEDLLREYQKRRENAGR